MLKNCLKLCPICLVFSWTVVRGAEEPRIDRIELLGTNLVTIHFETQARRGYALQFTDALCFSGASRLKGQCTIWSNLFSLPAFPFPNHYVVPDSRTNTHRTYRLQITQ